MNTTKDGGGAEGWRGGGEYRRLRGESTGDRGGESARDRVLKHVKVCDAPKQIKVLNIYVQVIY